MKLPKRIDKLVKEKLALLNSARSGFDNDIIRLQGELFSLITEDIISRLNIKDGIIQDNIHNYKLLTELDSVFDKFRTVVLGRIIPKINNLLEQLTALNNNYFQITLEEIPARFKVILDRTKDLTDIRLGLKGGKVIRGGNLWTYIRGGTDNTSFKQFVSRALTSNMSMKDFISTTSNIILGNDERAGLFDRQLKRYAYDVYGQYDAAYNLKLAEEFGMKYFEYQGGLVVDSRDFCREHNGHVYSVEEAQEWIHWTPADAVNITTFQQKDLNTVPSYMNYEGYDPLVDKGGYHCRHIISYMSDKLAFRLRPDLKNEK